jgi:hypothetical protein
MMKKEPIPHPVRIEPKAIGARLSCPENLAGVFVLTQKGWFDLPILPHYFPGEWRTPGVTERWGCRKITTLLM